MFALSRLAWAEFWKGFSLRRTGGAGARDFLWLTIFFFLMSFMAFTSWSARQGVWSRFEQVLLGALPNGAPPVRMGFHIDNVNKLDPNILDAFGTAFADLTIVPQREFDGKSGAIELPGMAVTGNFSSATVNAAKLSWDMRSTELRLLALPRTAPLWTWLIDRFGGGTKIGEARLPRVIVLNRHLFRQHFRYQVYREALLRERALPCGYHAYLPEKPVNLSELTHLILSVKENVPGRSGKRAQTTANGLHAFEIIWAEGLPVPNRVAGIVPLSTFEVLMVAEERQFAVLTLEADGQPARRVSELRLLDIDEAPTASTSFRKLAGCLGATHESRCQEATARKSDEATRKKLVNASDTAGNCSDLDRLRAPQLINNGFDMLICTGARRRLRAGEITHCSMDAGLGDLMDNKPRYDGQLSVIAAPPSQHIEWLGPARVEVPCEVLDEADFARLQGLAEQAGNQAVKGSMQVARSVADIKASQACHRARSAATGGDLADPQLRAVRYLDGYSDVTIYRMRRNEAVTSLWPVVAAARVWAQGGFTDSTLLKKVIDRTLASFKQDLTAPAEPSLDEVIGPLLAWQTIIDTADDKYKVPVFQLNAGYEASLVRFGVLSAIVNKISTPLAIGGGVLYIFLAGVILATAISHRRRQYGLIMMAGTRPSGIRRIVTYQILLSCLSGGFAGYGMFSIAGRVVDDWLKGTTIIAEARAILGLDAPNFLAPLTITDISIVWCGMTVAAILVGWCILRLQAITTAKAPIYLVRS